MTAAVATSVPWSGRSLAPWLIAIGGFAAMYLPTYAAASRVLWATDDFGHGPIILAVAVWLMWRARMDVLAASARPVPWLGWPVFGLGLLMYVAGRVLDISSVEFASQPVVITGAMLLLGGREALKAAWFPVLYWAFMVPLPSSLIDTLTAPLKHWVSIIVVELLYPVGYPIARSGVVLSIGPYQLLVADACSGLNSMLSLSALGALFVYLVGRRSRLHNALMLASILPIAFAANVLRVIVLVLVTYHLGDEAGQGFLHGAAGVMLMLAALAILFVLDRGLAVVLGRRGDAR